jgi:hypothetical protein
MKYYATHMLLVPVGDILYGDSVLPFDSGYANYYEAAERKFQEFMELSRQGANGSRTLLSGDNDFETLKIQLKLRQARCLLEASKAESLDSELRVRELCDEVVQSSATPTTSRAWANFYLGSLELNHARRTGSLYELWRGHSNLADHDMCYDHETLHSSNAFDHIDCARRHFLAAVSLLGSATEVFTRKVLRSLALVTGPEEPGHAISGMSACTLVLTSIGRVTRQRMLVELGAGNPRFEDHGGAQDLYQAFGAFDSDFNDASERNQAIERFFSQLAKVVPANWRFVALGLCPSGEILLTSIDMADGFRARTTCIFTQDSSDYAYNEILKPLDEIIQSSQGHLQGMDPAAATEHFSRESAKRTWWNERKKLDGDLKVLIETVETNFFGSSCIREAFSGDAGQSMDSIVGDEDLSCGNLALKFEAACDLSDKTPEKATGSNTSEVQAAAFERERLELKKLTVPKLKSQLLEFEIPESKMRKLRKDDLIDLLLEQQENRSIRLVTAPQSPRPESSSPATGEPCLFLILDENLHRFPFEGMPMLTEKTVCRIPSLPFVLATLLERQSVSKAGYPSVDPVDASYVLDPENNLIETRKRLLPVIERLTSQRGWDWNEAVGVIPSPTFFEKALTRENGLMLYCGHGGGQVCFSRRKVEKMIKGGNAGSNESDENGSLRACRATVILMGCSSGRLMSVNRKSTDSLEELPLYYDPEGIALSYLSAGSPCVIGNLWDVTDHDIDRYSMDLLERFLGDSDDVSSDETLAKCVSMARTACKMRYIVGCAPVCYGVPVSLHREE